MRRRIKQHNSPETGYWRLYHQAIREGDAVTAVTIARQGIDAYPKKRDRKVKGIWRRALAKALYNSGDYEAAIAAAKKACVDQPDQYERALSLITVAAYLSFIDEHDQAWGFYRIAANVMEKYGGDAHLWSHFYGTRALTLKRTGRRDLAILDWEGAVMMLEQSGQWARVAVLGNNVALLLIEMGCTTEAETRLDHCFGALEMEPHAHTEAMVQDSLGHLYSMHGRYEEALTLLTASEEGFMKIGDKPQLFGTVLHLAELFERKHAWVKARRYAAKALEIATEVGDPKLIKKAEEAITHLPSLALVEELVTG